MVREGLNPGGFIAVENNVKKCYFNTFFVTLESVLKGSKDIGYLQ